MSVARSSVVATIGLLSVAALEFVWGSVRLAAVSACVMPDRRGRPEAAESGAGPGCIRVAFSAPEISKVAINPFAIRAIAWSIMGNCPGILALNSRIAAAPGGTLAVWMLVKGGDVRDPNR